MLTESEGFDLVWTFWRVTGSFRKSAKDKAPQCGRLKRDLIGAHTRLILIRNNAQEGWQVYFQMNVLIETFVLLLKHLNWGMKFNKLLTTLVHVSWSQQKGSTNTVSIQEKTKEMIVNKNSWGEVTSKLKILLFALLCLLNVRAQKGVRSSSRYKGISEDGSAFLHAELSPDWLCAKSR